MAGDAPRRRAAATPARRATGRITDSPRIRLVAGALATLALLAGLVFGPDLARLAAALVPAPASPPLAVHVAGDHFVDGRGRPVVLRGVQRDGTDFACLGGRAIFDGPTDAWSIHAMLAWHVNVVRIPLNETCWLGSPALAPAVSGAAYRDAIAAYAHALTAAGLYVVVTLHKTAPGDGVAGAAGSWTEAEMPDVDHAPALWAQVAARLAGDPAVLFEPFNEPHYVSWPCLLDGGEQCPGLGYRAAGMQTLVDAIRGAGARNPILVGGLWYANDLSQWRQYAPVDPLRQLAAAWHVYPDVMACNNPQCLAGTLLPVLRAGYPVLATEFGADPFERHCGTDQTAPIVDWLDAHGIGYVAFTWNVWSQACGGLSLISSYDGAPKAPNGTWYRDHLAAVTRAGP